MTTKILLSILYTTTSNVRMIIFNFKIMKSMRQGLEGINYLYISQYLD